MDELGEEVGGRGPRTGQMHASHGNIVTRGSRPPSSPSKLIHFDPSLPSGLRAATSKVAPGGLHRLLVAGQAGLQPLAV
eukprot:6193800-Pyramimonas_sp.AAC.1